MTLCCTDRRRIFAHPRTAEWIASRLIAGALAYRFLLHAWCVMPDHVHFLVEGVDETCDLVAFVRRFKQRTSLEWSARSGLSLWQKNFYEHILRRDDAFPRVAAYIWNNPIRKGLCQDFREYPFSGSTTFDWKQSRPTPEMWQPPWKSHTQPPNVRQAPNSA